MMWGSWAEFWDMGGRGFYVWGSYGVFALCVIVELVALRGRAKRARRDLRRQISAERES